MNNKYNLDMKKVLKNTISYDDFMQEQLKDLDFQKDYLTASLEAYVEDGDFKAFFRALERVVKVRCSVTQFCNEADIERTNFYSLIRGNKKPKLETVLKIFKALGFELKVA